MLELGSKFTLKMSNYPLVESEQCLKFDPPLLGICYFRGLTGTILVSGKGTQKIPMAQDDRSTLSLAFHIYTTLTSSGQEYNHSCFSYDLKYD